jgi:hypothetical protein
VLQTRTESIEVQEPEQARDEDTFGYYNDLERIEHGWLTAETIVQFKIANGPINFWRKKHKNATVSSKYAYSA